MFLLDTNIVIYAINSRRRAVADRLDQEVAAGTPLFLSTIVLYELEYGIARGSQPAKSRRLRDDFLAGGIEILPFDRADAAEAAVLRAALEAVGTPIGPYDTLIAAQARRRGLTLVSANGREFSRVAGLALEDWSG